MSLGILSFVVDAFLDGSMSQARHPAHGKLMHSWVL